MGDHVSRLVETLRAHGMPSVRNLLVTVFGDSIRPYGVAVSVGSLTRLLEQLDVSDRLVRTSLTRLADDDLVAVNRSGNRSYYGVDQHADALFERAEERIYHYPKPVWDGRWTVAIIDGASGSSDQRTALRRQLGWLGLGPIAPNVLASPLVAVGAVVDVVDDVALRDAVLVMRSETVPGLGLISDVGLAERVVPLTELAARYREINTWFAPFLRGGVDPLSPAQSYLMRVLLIATYRRVVLADPSLPEGLLPDAWEGRAAFDSVGELYRDLHEKSEQWLREVVETPDGSRLAKPQVGRRFVQSD